MKMNDLIPGYSEHNFFRYYMYMGSMTTPPCQNWGVRWVVVKQAAQISTEQLSKFPFLNNSRPLQVKLNPPICHPPFQFWKWRFSLPF